MKETHSPTPSTDSESKKSEKNERSLSSSKKEGLPTPAIPRRWREALIEVVVGGEGGVVGAAAVEVEHEEVEGDPEVGIVPAYLTVDGADERQDEVEVGGTSSAEHVETLAASDVGAGTLGEWSVGVEKYAARPLHAVVLERHAGGAGACVTVDGAGEREEVVKGAGPRAKRGGGVIYAAGEETCDLVGVRVPADGGEEVRLGAVVVVVVGADDVEELVPFEALAGGLSGEALAVVLQTAQLPGSSRDAGREAEVGVARLPAGMPRMRITVEEAHTYSADARSLLRMGENAATVLASDPGFGSDDRVAQRYASAKMHLHWSIPHSQRVAASHWSDV